MRGITVLPGQVESARLDDIAEHRARAPERRGLRDGQRQPPPLRGRRHARQAGQAWLERLVSRRSGLEAWAEGLQRRPDDVSSVIDFTPVTRSFPPKR